MDERKKTGSFMNANTRLEGWSLGEAQTASPEGQTAVDPHICCRVRLLYLNIKINLHNGISIKLTWRLFKVTNLDLDQPRNESNSLQELSHSTSSVFFQCWMLSKDVREIYTETVAFALVVSIPLRYCSRLCRKYF